VAIGLIEKPLREGVMKRNKLVRGGLIGAAVILFLAVLVAAVQACIAFDGLLDEQSPISQYRPGCRYAIHMVRLDAGEPHVFLLNSKEFDAYLILADLSGGILAEDDNNGEADEGKAEITNARFIYTAEVTGWYQLMATTADPEEMGKYQVVIKDLDKPSPPRYSDDNGSK
jgi:hypothetical protein